MAEITIRNQSNEVHLTSSMQAASHNRDAEAAVKAEGVKLGSLLASIGTKANLTDEEFALFYGARDRALAKPVSFE